jgi:hypothetical protein
MLRHNAYARYHSYDAVSELIEYKRATEDMFAVRQLEP